MNLQSGISNRWTQSCPRTGGVLHAKPTLTYPAALLKAFWGGRGFNPTLSSESFFRGQPYSSVSMIRAAYMSLEAGVAASELDREVARLRAGDPDALGALLARYQNRLYRYLLRIVRERGTAEDLFQQTWLRVVENIRRYDPRRSFEAWLFSVAHNLAIDHVRRVKPASLDELTEDGTPNFEGPAEGGPDALERALEQERAGLVITALEEQPAFYREVLSLRFEEEMKLDEIAMVLDVPLSTVKTRLRRGLERMRDSLVRRAPQGMWPEGTMQ